MCFHPDIHHLTHCLLVGRVFPIDMAGFAVNLAFLNTRPVFFQSEPYLQEELFLRGLGITLQEFEPKANNCTEVKLCVSVCECMCMCVWMFLHLTTRSLRHLFL